MYLYCISLDFFTLFDISEDIISVSDNLGQSRQQNSNVERSESRGELRSSSSQHGAPPPFSSYLITHAHTRPYQGPRTGIKLRAEVRYVQCIADWPTRSALKWRTAACRRGIESPTVAPIVGTRYLSCPSNVRFLRQFVGRQSIVSTSRRYRHFDSGHSCYCFDQ